MLSAIEVPALHGEPGPLRLRKQQGAINMSDKWIYSFPGTDVASPLYPSKEKALAAAKLENDGCNESVVVMPVIPIYISDCVFTDELVDDLMQRIQDDAESECSVEDPCVLWKSGYENYNNPEGAKAQDQARKELGDFIASWATKYLSIDPDWSPDYSRMEEFELVEEKE